MTGTSSDDLSGDYVVDAACTRLGFVARHALVARVHGHVERFTGRARIDLADRSRTRIEVDVEAGSVTTHLRPRDAPGGIVVADAVALELDVSARRVSAASADAASRSTARVT
jgi:polyisoprenoid-binding protein YceI